MSWFRISPSAFGKYGLVLLVIVLAWQGYRAARPAAPALDPLRLKAASRIAERASGSISAYAGADWSGRYVKVARLQGDHGDHIRTLLEDGLAARTNCIVVRDSLVSDLRDGISDAIAHVGILNQPRTDEWKRKPVTTLSAALHLAKNTKVDYVVYGVVSDFRVVDGSAQAVLDVHLADPIQGEDVFAERFTEGPGLIHHSAMGSVSGHFVRDWLWKCVAWGMFVVLLPVVTASFWMTVLGNESNGSTFLALLLLTAVDGLLAWTLMEFSIPTVWAAVVLGLSASGAFTWNLFILGMLEQARSRQPYEHVRPLA